MLTLYRRFVDVSLLSDGVINLNFHLIGIRVRL
jgi:hypothetical protein